MPTKAKKKKASPKRVAKKAAVKKPAKKPIDVAAEVARRNRLFAKATPAGKRVLIAEDIIAQIKAKRFRPKAGVWVNPVNEKNTENIELDIKFNGTAPVRELFLEKKIPACECCALGALFMSCTLYNNQTTVNDFTKEVILDFQETVEDGKFTNGLTGFFSRAQLKLIEIAFEGGYGAFDTDRMSNTKALRVVSWEEKLPDDQKRLVAIMNNIINNKGTFVP
jgi:hypothetical protein